MMLATILHARRETWWRLNPKGKPEHPAYANNG